MTTVAQEINNDEENQSYNIELTFHNSYDYVDDKEVQNIETYEDIIGYQVSNTVVAVMTKEGETLVYPLDRLTKIRHFPVAA